MRISTSMLFNSGTQGILKLQADMVKTQDQLSSGRRMLTPADDPIAALESLQVEQLKGVNEQYIANQKTALSRLSSLESSLGSLGDALMNMRVAAESAFSPLNGPTEFGMIATDLRQIFDSVFDLANSRDAFGNYVFAGFQADRPPFERNGLNVSYEGDQGLVSLQVAPSISMAIGENGDALLMRVRDPQGGWVTADPPSTAKLGVFEIMSLVIQKTEAGTVTKADMEKLEAGIDHLLKARTSVGSRLNSLDRLAESASGDSYLYDVRLSELRDLDFTEAISRFSRYKVQLEAAQITFKQTSQLSLFNII